MGAWTADQIKTALNLAVAVGAVIILLGMAFGQFVLRVVNWLFPMVTIALGRGIETEERRKRIRWWVVVTPLGALVAIALRSILSD